ncbi:MAG TPA: AAA family ATPase, partial [Candidatus Paceibacterota bacterium]|nr:AAA family ATPase [Candidatus Paceibacterota bacterium]
KSLELSGFKSFAKKTELNFTSAITGIVGPNGSGKSNVAEAFRFVLGEQSMKSMRGKRGEDLIFSGSKTLPKPARASAKLVFNNNPKVFNVDFDEVSLERTVYRDGTNEYRLNGTQVRLKDILELLASANIGASGHHIISQGEADRILNASIKERKAMIEDALGLKVYQYKREESERKLEKTGENMKQVESLRKELAPHLRFLEKQMEKVRKAEALKRELETLYQEYLKREEAYLNEERTALASALKAPTAELAAVDARVKDIEALLSGKGRDKEGREFAEAEKALREAEEETEKLRREESRLDGIIFAEEKALARAAQSGQSESVTIPRSELERVVAEAESFVAQASREENISVLRNLLNTIAGLIRSFVSGKRAGSDHSGEIEAEIGKLKEEKAALVAKAAGALGKSEAARKHYQELKEAIEADERSGREAEREMFALVSKRNDLSQQLFMLRSREDALKRDEAAFKSELIEGQALLGLPVLRYSEVVIGNVREARHEQEARRKNLEKMKIRLEEMGGAGGADTEKEYEETRTRDAYLEKELADLAQSAETLKGLIAELSEKLEKEFAEGMAKINKEFQKFFALMFGGGSAALSTIEAPKRRRVAAEDLEGEIPEEPEEGIDISVSLPNKRTKGLQMLSGGERALTSIALLFAISQVNPPPFVILDETDAALDEANSRKYGDMVESLAKYSQLILITHNRETMSRAGVLYGVTMGSEGASKLLSVRFDDAVAVAK